MVVFYVTDERNIRTCRLLALLFNDIYINEVRGDEEHKVFINTPCIGNNAVCIVDSWCLYDDIPDAHLIPKHGTIKRIWAIIELMHLNAHKSDYEKVDISDIKVPQHAKHLVDLFPDIPIVVSEHGPFADKTDTHIARSIFYTLSVF